MKNLFFFIVIYFVVPTRGFAAVQKIVDVPATANHYNSSILISKKRKRQIKKMDKIVRKLKYRQGDSDLNISLGIGLAMAASSVIFFFMGLFGLGVLLGAIGGLICFQLWMSEANTQLPILGAGIGLTSALLSFVKSISAWAD